MRIQLRRRLPFLALALIGALLPAAAAQAAARDETLRWYPPADESVAGFVLYMGESSGSYAESFDLGWVEPDSQGIASFALGSLPSSLTDGDVYVSMTAYYATSAGAVALESPPSNELFFPVGLVSANPSDPGDGTPGDDGTGSDEPPPSDDPVTPGDGSSGDGGDGSGGSGGSTVTPLPIDFDYREDFEGYLAAEDPQDWFDTAGSAAIYSDPQRFGAAIINDGAGGDNTVLRTGPSSDASHSHFVGAGSESWNGFEFSGRLRTSDAAGEVGVSFLSALPDADQAYLLRHTEGQGFELTGFGVQTPSCRGQLPEARANAWHRFRIRTWNEEAGLRIRAKVWAEDGSEPRSWPLRCSDDSGTARLAGRIGTWALGSGEKHWDDLRVFSLDASGVPAPQCDVHNDCGAGDYCSSEHICVAEQTTAADALFAANFETDPLNAPLSDWQATGPHSLSNGSGDSIGVFSEPGRMNRVLGTHHENLDIHAHVATAESSDWSYVEWSGRMIASDRDGSIGVTIHSDHPHSDSYYSLRSEAGGAFRFVSHRGGASTSESCANGSLQTSFTPNAKHWTHFRLKTGRNGTDTRVMAKVWREGKAEPTGWPIDCTDPAATALEFGTVGVWADGEGRKYWDDLVVRATP